MGISDEKMVDRYRFPVTHWIMMSLNSEYKTHVDEDVDFTMSFDTYDAKKQANIREIKARLENISTPYEACKMAYHKVARTWDSGGFSYGKYLSRSDPSGGLREVLHSRLLGIYVNGISQCNAHSNGVWCSLCRWQASPLCFVFQHSDSHGSYTLFPYLGKST